LSEAVGSGGGGVVVIVLRVRVTVAPLLIDLVALFCLKNFNRFFAALLVRVVKVAVDQDPLVFVLCRKASSGILLNFDV
jgi:hypothetical protein